MKYLADLKPLKAVYEAGNFYVEVRKDKTFGVVRPPKPCECESTIERYADLGLAILRCAYLGKVKMSAREARHIADAILK